MAIIKYGILMENNFKMHICYRNGKDNIVLISFNRDVSQISISTMFIVLLIVCKKFFKFLSCIDTIKAIKHFLTKSYWFYSVRF